MNEPDERLFSGVNHGRTADEVVNQIELLILDGVLRDGDRLPGERDLALSLEVSRPILREALKELEARGLLVSQHGGGTFVADIIGQIFSQPVTDLISRHGRATRDYMEYRRELEGLTASLAAERASETDRTLLTGIVDRMQQAHLAGDAEAELSADIEFHNVIGECAHNIILLHTMRACYRLLSEGILLNRNAVYSLPHARDRLLEQHLSIHAAIMAGDAVAARDAAQAHIDFVIEAAEQSSRTEEWNRIARLRMIKREGGRVLSRKD